MKKETPKESFDKIQKIFYNQETKHEMCALSVVDSRMRGLGLSGEELEVISTLIKECIVDGEVNYVMFTNRLGTSLDQAAYALDWDTQQLP